MPFYHYHQNLRHMHNLLVPTTERRAHWTQQQYLWCFDNQTQEQSLIFSLWTCSPGLHSRCINTRKTHSSVQFSCSVVSESLWPHGLQYRHTYIVRTLAIAAVNRHYLELDYTRENMGEVTICTKKPGKDWKPWPESGMKIMKIPRVLLVLFFFFFFLFLIFLCFSAFYFLPCFWVQMLGGKCPPQNSQGF